MEDFSPVDKIKGDDMEVVSFLILLSNTLQTEELGFLRLTAKSWHSQSGLQKGLTCCSKQLSKCNLLKIKKSPYWYN